jgi:uncharacterized protein (DUF58 family)
MKQKINIAAIVALALIAATTSASAFTQMVVFVVLLAVVFGRDVWLQKSRDKSVA